MIFTALHEAFFTYIKVSFWTAIFVAFPFVASQFWRCVAPGLYGNEKKALLPYLIISLPLDGIAIKKNIISTGPQISI